MEQFNPVFNIYAVSERDVMVAFDLAHPDDRNRTPSLYRISSNFSSLHIVVEDFKVAGDVDSRREFRGAVKLLLEDSTGAQSELVLTKPMLSLPMPLSPRKKRVDPPQYPTEADVTSAIRAGVSRAFSQALAGYMSKADYLDTIARSPLASAPQSAVAAAFPTGAFAAPASMGSGALWRGPVATSAANEAAPTATPRRKTAGMAVAVVCALVVVFLLAGALRSKPDPVQSAVAKAMEQNPQSAEAQVALTKDVLKQMGLDPGKSGDTGCLTGQ